MKKLTLALAASALLSSAAFAQSNTASNFIEFSGEVTEAACSVTAGTVNLNSLTTRALKDDGDAGPWGTAYIDFYGCELEGKAEGGGDLKSVKIEVTPGAPDDTNDALWKNLGTAKNVGVEVEMANTKITPAGNIGTGITADLTEAGAKVEVRGRTVKVGADASTAGSVNTRVNFVASFL
ncbi:hypothetical protein MMG00_06320 [Ignatzschineria rhizosphaerae]|uniref:Fimbrial-type adhesion domain-containing protein n=1 Tax=Ignatzschineria rhizosphaerae TaxID=2923279 RepID=A0ABY3X9M5_9GAMM|nr:fimbrial protein [Ignatzschineria rhizosphaerae]UNM97455.1 hypothetical protein MMG00_06320 [Ignatzschineria rhizosphaerae]